MLVSTLWRGVALWGAGLALLVVGCRAPEPIPAHDWPGTREALRVIDERNSAIQSVSAAFNLTIEDDQGGSGSLEGALAARRDGYTRIQAWRFHRELMDLTRTPEGTWLWTAERVEQLEEQLAHQDAEALDWFELFVLAPDPQRSEVLQEGGDNEPMVVRSPLDGPGTPAGWSMLAQIDRATLTVRRMAIHDDAGRSVQQIAFERYGMVDGQVFPVRIAASGHWNMTLRLHEIVLNDELPAAVFEPPAKARRQE